MAPKPDHKPSTSALAKTLGIPSQQLFSTLKDYGWIRKVDEGWELTSKGEFEGGEYVHSKKFGRYIVWPESLAEHPLLLALEDSRFIAATVLGKNYGLTAAQVNRLLAELGWIKHSFQGWELTPLGDLHGGVHLENENSGTFYVVWPESVQTDPTLIRQLTFGQIVSAEAIAPSNVGDLFLNQQEWIALDGHQHQSRAHLQVCHCLYLAGINHACHRQLPVSEPLFADFYLPAHQLYIECWGEDDNSKALANKMKRNDYYKKLGFTVIDIEKDELKHIDDVLTRVLRKHGIKTY